MNKKNLLKELRKKEQEVGENPIHKGIREKKELKNYAIKRAREEIARARYLNALNEEEKETNEEARYPLSITESKLFKIELSTGGDADGFLIELDTDGQLMGGVYYWSDWGVYQEVNLTYEEAEEVARCYELIY